jgi:hypothetical protein
MSKPAKPDNPADCNHETLTDEKHGTVKDKQLEGNRRPDTDLARGLEPATFGSSRER